MKTNNYRTQLVGALLGVGLVAATAAGINSYLRVERDARATEALTATLDQLYHDQSLSLALKKIHEGDVTGASRQLDILLCDDVLLRNAELASADARTQMLVRDAFRRIGQVRPKTEPAAPTGAASEVSEDQIAAQRLLELAVADRLIAASKEPGM
jgi:hypothetical protein